MEFGCSERIEHDEAAAVAVAGLVLSYMQFRVG